LNGHSEAESLMRGREVRAEISSRRQRCLIHDFSEKAEETSLTRVERFSARKSSRKYCQTGHKESDRVRPNLLIERHGCVARLESNKDSVGCWILKAAVKRAGMRIDPLSGNRLRIVSRSERLGDDSADP